MIKFDRLKALDLTFDPTGAGGGLADQPELESKLGTREDGRDSGNLRTNCPPKVKQKKHRRSVSCPAFQVCKIVNYYSYALKFPTF